ncbi:MAG: hypothetical protein RR555_05090 [Bacteroidales bacterium]
MKTTLKLFLSLAIVLFATQITTAQQSAKELKKELKANVVKDVKKSAKKLVKEGWKTMPGLLPIEKQIQATQFAQLDKDDKGNLLNLVGTNRAISQSYSAAKQMADHRAKMELARAVSTAITEKIKENTANNNLGDGDIELIEEFISANQATVSNILTNVKAPLAIYRQLGDNKYEVDVAVSVNAKDALKAAKSALTSKLAKKSAKLSEALDKIL